MLSLPNVTLFSTAGDTAHITIDTFTKCMSQVTFGDAIMFSEVDLWPQKFKIYKIPLAGSAQKSGIHYIRNLPPLLDTSHILAVDWDSWLICPECWTDEYLQYDYIGSKWPWKEEGKNIGNSGFALISKRLLEILGKMDLPENGTLDADIGQKWRPMLESEHGIKFAPTELADIFSYEVAEPQQPTFGFHSMVNFWRHMEDDDLIALLLRLPDRIILRDQYVTLMKIYLGLRKFKPLIAMKERREQVLNNQCAA